MTRGAKNDVARPCKSCGHRHTPTGCQGAPTPSDTWAGVTPAACDCDSPAVTADEAYDRLHGLDGHTQAVTPRYTSEEVVEALVQQVAECEWLLRMTTDARDRAERQAETNEAEVERLRAVLAEVQRAFSLKCPPMPPEKYVDRGAWMAHSWWNTVLGDILNRGFGGDSC